MSIVFKFANENSAKNIPLLPTAISYVGGILLCWDEVLVVVHNVKFYCFPCINGVYWSAIIVSPSSSVLFLSKDCFKYIVVLYIIIFL